MEWVYVVGVVGGNVCAYVHSYVCMCVQTGYTEALQECACLW